MKLSAEDLRRFQESHAAYQHEQKRYALAVERARAPLFAAENAFKIVDQELHIDLPPGLVWDVWGEGEAKPLDKCTKPPGAT